MSSKFKFYCLINCLMLGLTIGCASFNKKAGNRMDIPPGLDSTTVVISSKMADENFVSSRREKEAKELAKIGKENLTQVDEFWSYLSRSVKKEDAMTENEKQQFDREFTQGAKALKLVKKLSKNGKDLQPVEAAFDQCLKAQHHLEQALRINPFDKNPRMLLSVTYYYLQHHFGLQGNHAKAVEILERLIRIEKGEHELFRLLAENYLALKEYDLAFSNFNKALDVMIKISFDAPPDTSMLFYYNHAMGDAYARKYDATNAVKTLKIAREFARTEQEKSDVNNYLNWIKWDGGNIRASEVWDHVLELETSKNYAEMAKACVNLLPSLTTNKAKISVMHQVAVVEFEFLDQIEQAVERMHQVYETLSGTSLESDSLEIRPYLDTYGAMLYRLGVEALEREDKKLALAYYHKAASFEWEQVAKVFYELMGLLWNNSEQVITYGEKALAHHNGLSEQQYCNLMSRMTRVHKSKGQYDEARIYYNKWKQCQE